MTATEIILKLADQGYWAKLPTYKQAINNPASVGDTLACFITIELTEVVEGLDDTTELDEARRSIKNAIQDLSLVLDELTIENYRQLSGGNQ